MRFTAVLALSALSCTNTMSSGFTLSVSQSTLPADGMSRVDVTAELGSSYDGAVVQFAMDGVGLLGATSAIVVAGKATIAAYAPSELDIASPPVPTTITATVPVTSGTAPTASTTVTFTVPTDGPPLLKAAADPAFVLVGDTAPFIVKLEGRRLTSDVVTLTSSNAALQLPETATLAGDGPVRTAELSIPALDERDDVVITVSAPGAASINVDVKFYAEGDPAFDVGGQFVQITHGTVRISNYGLLANDPDCIVSDNISLVTIEQEGNVLKMTSETCVMEMATVTVSFLGATFDITPTVGPGFLRAANRLSPQLEFALPTVDAGASFDVPADALALPLVMGAVLDDPINDELPDDPNAEAQMDHDEDGEPGVTIQTEGVGNQHVCSRSFTRSMSGTIVDSNVIKGVALNESESKVFGGSFGGSPTIEGLPSEYALQRVDGKYNAPNIAARSGDPNVITCDDVKAYKSEMKAAYPVENPVSCE